MTQNLPNRDELLAAAMKLNSSADGDRLVNRTHFGAENGPTWEAI